MTSNDTTQNFQARFQRYRKEYPTLKDATYYAMRDAILLNFFENEITEAQVATLLSISRTPIREAMLQLSRDGLLEISPGRKARIVPLTAQDLSDISTILDSLHTLSVSLCIDRADDNSLRQLEECVALIRFYTDRMDLRHLAECNTRFHVQIAKAGGNRWLTDIMSRLLSYTSVYREYAVSRPGRMEMACREHAEIYAALCRRDKAAALQLTHEHVRKAFTVVDTHPEEAAE